MNSQHGPYTSFPSESRPYRSAPSAIPHSTPALSSMPYWSQDHQSYSPHAIGYSEHASSVGYSRPSWNPEHTALSTHDHQFSAPFENYTPSSEHLVRVSPRVPTKTEIVDVDMFWSSTRTWPPAHNAPNSLPYYPDYREQHIPHPMFIQMSPTLSQISTPSTSPSPHEVYAQLPPHSTVNRKTARRASTDAGSGKECSHCHATSTPLWRRDPATLRSLCNACGLYLQQRNKLRPQELIDADNDDEESDHDGTGPECSHCRTHNTSVWRRSKTGAQLCNACGVYLRLRGTDRPLSLKRNKIKPRSKHTTTTKSSVSRL